MIGLSDRPIIRYNTYEEALEAGLQEALKLTIICIIALLWVGDLTITFKPFSISLPGWHKALGIILFVFAMAVYNIGEYAKGYKHGFDDGVKECIETIKGNGKNRADSNN